MFGAGFKGLRLHKRAVDSDGWVMCDEWIEARNYCENSDDSSP